MEGKKQKRVFFRMVFGRTGIVVALLLIQLGLLFLSWLALAERLHMMVWLMGLVEAAVVIGIFNKDTSTTTVKLAWIVPIILAPALGIGLYFFVQANFGIRAMRQRMSLIFTNTKANVKQKEALLDQLEQKNPGLYRLSQYLYSTAAAPLYTNTAVTYFSSGEEKRVALLDALKSAKKFIFLEYFIIGEGIWWKEILSVLEQKVAEGVEVRVMFDGIGTLLTLPTHYEQQLRKKGIQAKVFSPVIPLLSTHQNNRDHRKIAVIDGQIAFTGGINLADEYINAISVHGHWKDTAVLLRGEAVQNFTQMFLQMWNVTETKLEDFTPYLNSQPVEAKGYVIGYGDSPLDWDLQGEEVYLHILNQATNYVHITTPYLVTDDHLLQGLLVAAKSGVDVKLILPGIPDKFLPNTIAKSFYPVLIANGVEIYEYTPGFIHAKSFVSDDVRAVVGTINLDFRSLYHHFECAAYMEEVAAVADVEADFQKTLALCRRITMKEYKEFPLRVRMCGKVMRILAPLM